MVSFKGLNNANKLYLFHAFLEAWMTWFHWANGTGVSGQALFVLPCQSLELKRER